jgi:hypothetical protein
MYYWPSAQDVWGTLPPVEQAELRALTAEHASDTSWAAYAEAERRQDENPDDTT